MFRHSKSKTPEPINEAETGGQNRTKKNTLRRFGPWALIVISSAVLIYSLSNIVWYYYQSLQNKNQNDQLQQIYQPASSATASDDSASSEAPGLDTYGVPALKAMNSDTVGWITIPNTSVSYPVLKGTDNNYYLKHDFYKKYNDHGSIYLDYRCTFDSFKGNTVIYGHNMKDGQMFGSLVNYADAAYYKNAPFIVIDTGGEKTTWVIFAMFYASVDEEQGPVFYYNRTSFPTSDSYSAFLKQMLVRSVLKTGVSVKSSDPIITLSTCAYNFENARFAVVARKLRPSEQQVIDGSAVSKNANALYPDIWYQIYGGTKPDEQQLIDALS